MAIIWREKLSVGDDGIDGDHQRMFRILNDYEAALMERDIRAIQYIFKTLAQHCNDHFSREVALLRKIGFPDADRHQDTHIAMSGRLNQIHDRFSQQSTKTAALDDLSALLRHWIVHHIVKEDLQMRPYLARWAPLKRRSLQSG